MLEDGEIDGDDEILTNTPSPLDDNNHEETQSHQKSHRSKKSSRKHSREKRHHDLDDRIDTQNDSDDHSGGHKRKNKSSSSSSSKRNKKHSHQASLDLLEEDLVEPTYDENSIGGDIDERFIPMTNANIPSAIPPSIYNTTLNQDQINIAASLTGVNTLLAQQTTASLLDLFKTTPGLLGADPSLLEKENSKPLKKKTLLGKPEPTMGDGDRKRKVLLQTPDEADMTVSVESIEKKVRNSKCVYSNLSIS
jgi:hypothetical protein